MQDNKQKKSSASFSSNDDFINNYTCQAGDGSLNITFEDTDFDLGALVTILNTSHGPYKDHVVLEMHSKDNAGNPTMVYNVVNPDGEQLAILENSGNWQSQIDAKLNPSSPSRQNPPEQSTSPASTKTSVDLTISDVPFNGVKKSSLVESIHGYNVEYSRYYSVIIPEYPLKGRYPFKYAIEFVNPAYTNPDTEFYFAVAGTIHDVRIQSQGDMNAAPKEYKVADTIEDALILVQTSFPTDFSVDKIFYRDFDGKNYSVTFTEMTEEYKVYGIKLPF